MGPHKANQHDQATNKHPNDKKPKRLSSSKLASTLSRLTAHSIQNIQQMVKTAAAAVAAGNAANPPPIQIQGQTQPGMPVNASGNLLPLPQNLPQGAVAPGLNSPQSSTSTSTSETPPQQQQQQQQQQLQLQQQQQLLQQQQQQQTSNQGQNQRDRISRPAMAIPLGNSIGSGGSGSSSAQNLGTGSLTGSKPVQEIFHLLRDYMSKCDLTSYGPKPHLAPNAWTHMITNDRKTFSLIIMKVLSEMRTMFKNEERMVSVASPLYIFGDIHGNLHDLRHYERDLWPQGPGRAKFSFVFLGDYVDRGHNSLEVILYLFCCKLMSRKNTFVLIRGNHELRAIQQAFTFHRECVEKLGLQVGVQVWNQLNKVFDCMPVAALVDGRIFCCHGGVPASSQNIKDILSVPCPLIDPENQSPLAWELMWNDPLTNSVFGEMSELLRLTSGSRAFLALKGFLPNNKRGTAYYFSETAALKFMNENSLSHVIRAHECLPTGYTLHSNQKLITVFSSSKYCGGSNDAACVLVEADDVRVIRLDIGEHPILPQANLSRSDSL